MMNVDELDPELFTYRKYEPNYGARLDLDFMHSIDDKTMSREIKKRCVGYCDGARLLVRPKSDSYAVMLEDDDFEQFWFHWPKESFEKILNK